MSAFQISSLKKKTSSRLDLSAFYEYKSMLFSDGN